MDGSLPPHVAEITQSIRREFSTLCTSLGLVLTLHNVACAAFAGAILNLTSIPARNYNEAAANAIVGKFISDIAPVASGASPAVVDRLAEEIRHHLAAAGRLIIVAASRRAPPSAISRSINAPVPCLSPPPPLNSFVPAPLAVVVAESALAAAIATAPYDR